VTTLLLMRHAKASSDPGFADHDRPLSAKGRRGAELVGEWLAARSAGEVHVLCSSSRRTRETLALLQVAGALDRARIEIESDLYLASAGDLLVRLQRLDASEASPVLAVGHNPGLHELAVALAGEGDRDACDHLRAAMPPGAIAWLESERAPRDLAPGCARLVAFATPRELAEAAGEEL